MFIRVFLGTNFRTRLLMENKACSRQLLMHLKLQRYTIKIDSANRSQCSSKIKYSQYKLRKKTWIMRNFNECLINLQIYLYMTWTLTLQRPTNTCLCSRSRVSISQAIWRVQALQILLKLCLTPSKALQRRNRLHLKIRYKISKRCQKN